jgi:antitoxin CcdA
MSKLNGYRGLHRRGSIKGEIHKAFDENGLDAALALGEKIRRETGSEKPKESSIRTWASFFKNHPGFGSGDQYRAARDRRNQEPLAATVANNVSEGFGEEAHSFRGEHVRTTARPGRRISISVEMDEALLMEAKAMDINLSDFVEEDLRTHVKDRRGRRWSEENKAFINSYNAYIERNGVFGEELLDLDDPPV